MSTAIRAIPMLPCASIQETLDFYVALGFEITYQQTRPNNYGCVKFGDIDLHFFTLKGYEPANSYSSCLILISDADALYQQFIASLRGTLGKIPAAGIPRITKPSNKNSAGDYRFNVIDPGGNWIRFIQQSSKPETVESPEIATNKLARAILAADLLVNAKGDFEGAAKMLDSALALSEADVTPVQRVKALVLRAECAMNLGDEAASKRFLSMIAQLSLTDEERERLSTELQHAEVLAEMF